MHIGNQNAQQFQLSESKAITAQINDTDRLLLLTATEDK